MALVERVLDELEDRNQGDSDDAQGTESHGLHGLHLTQAAVSAIYREPEKQSDHSSLFENG